MGDRLTLLLPRIGWGALVAAAFLIPVAGASWLADPFSLPKATIWWAAAILAAVGAVVGAASHRTWPIPRLRILLPVAALVAWTILATVASPQPMVSLLGQYGRYDGLAALLCGAVVALAIVAGAGRDPGRLVALVWAIVAGGAVSLVVVVAQGLGWGWTGLPATASAGQAIVGLAGNANFSGALLALVVPFVLGLRTYVVAPSQRVALVVAAVALSGGVLGTETRGGLLALFAGVAAFGLLAPDLLPKVVRIGAAVALVVGLTAVAVVSTSDPLPGTTPLGVERIVGRASLGERANLWAGATAMVQESPLVGTGPDAFGLRFAFERPSRSGGRALIIADEAHDVYLDRAATAGLPALAAYLWLVVTVATVAWRGRRAVAVEHRWLLAAFGGAFAGYLAQGAFSIDMVPLAWLSWVSVDAISALADPAVLARRTSGDPEPAAWSVPPLALVGIIGVTLVGLGLAIRPALADRHARAGMDASAAGHPLQAYAEFAEAAGWLDHEPRYHQRQASALVAAASSGGTDPELRRSLLDEALIAYDHALRRAPGDAGVRRAQAQTHLLAAQAAAYPSQAEAHVAAAIEIDRALIADARADDDLHLAYGRALEARANLASGAAAQRDRDLAAAQYVAARLYFRDRAGAIEGLARLAVAEGRLLDARTILREAERDGVGSDRIDAAIEDLDRRIEAGS